MGTHKNLPEKQPDHAIELPSLISRLEEIRESITVSEAGMAAKLASVNPVYSSSARNLVHYLALRRHDIRGLQDQLATLGLSSLGRAEAHVMATLDAVLGALYGLAGRGWQPHPSPASFSQGKKLLEEHARALLGPGPQGRSVRIMVTMPSEAALDYALVRGLVAAGMDCMRINCAYDDARAWAHMIEHLVRAREELGKGCRVVMDLAGPKLRVGPIEPGPELLKIRPSRDLRGQVTKPARIWLVPATREGQPLPTQADAVLPIAEGDLASLQCGAGLTFRDARGANRRFTVVTVADGCVLVECRQTSYVVSGHELTVKRTPGLPMVFKVGVLPPLESPIILKRGDRLTLSKEPRLGRGAELEKGRASQRGALITCNMPEILGDIRAGERVWFDDGKIGGVVREAHSDHAEIEITQARIGGSKLRENKGINLPDTDLRIPCFTAKDLEDLPFVAAHADVVEMSFVRRPQDVQELRAQLARLTDRPIGVVLKIEARKAFDNLPELVLAVMQHPCAGVMIARGDLALECGYERLAEAQEEILWICEAAHLPVIWATQVLESFAKTGQPSRAEITDAAMGERAECVMLNKGPYIIEAVASLDDILRRMEAHQVKKTSRLRALAVVGKLA
jgi:pyruvate kinase